MVEIKSLNKKFKKKFALKNINIKLNNTGFISIVGESGSGKTAL